MPEISGQEGHLDRGTFKLHHRRLATLGGIGQGDIIDGHAGGRKNPEAQLAIDRQGSPRGLLHFGGDICLDRIRGHKERACKGRSDKDDNQNTEANQELSHERISPNYFDVSWTTKRRKPARFPALQINDRLKDRPPQTQTAHDAI